MNVVSLGGGGGDAAISTIREGKDETCDVDDDGGMESLSNNDHNHQKKGVHNSNNNDNDNHNHNDMDEEEDEDDNESMDMDRGVNRRDEINRAFPSQPPGMQGQGKWVNEQGEMQHLETGTNLNGSANDNDSIENESLLRRGTGGGRGTGLGTTLGGSGGRGGFVHAPPSSTTTTITT